MKKSHLIIYFLSFALVALSYIYYVNVYAQWEVTTYLHSIHWAAFGYLLIPILFELIFKKELPLSLLIGYIVFIFASQIYGTGYDGYGKFACWDLIVHGFSATLVVLFFAYLSRSHLEKSHVLHQILYLLGVAMLVGVLWEIIEFCGDSWFGMNNQVYRCNGVPYVGQDALKDTMMDLIWDLIGASVGVIIVFMPKSLQKIKTQKETK